MSLRSLTRLLLLSASSMLAVSGCSFDAGAPVSDLPNDPDDEPTASLAVVGSAQVFVKPGSSEELKVRYTSTEGQALIGHVVDFAVLAADGTDMGGMGPLPIGASLTPANPTTDGGGIASASLRVGTTPGTFQVRASTADSDPVFFSVTVSPAVQPTVTVQVKYMGLRTIASRTVTLLEAAGCPEPGDSGAELELGDQVHTYMNPEQSVVFDGLGPGLDYIILAWGRDQTGAELAAGCHAFQAPVEPDPAKAQVEAVVELSDLSMRLKSKYELVLDLRVEESAARVGQLVRDTTAAALPGTATTEADWYLAALDAALRAAGESAAANELNADLTLAPGLQAALAAQAVGPSAAGEALAGWVVRAGEKLLISGQYGIGASSSMPMLFDVASVRAQSLDGEVAFELTERPSYNVPTAMLTATYDNARAVVDVSTLSIACPLGGYGRALLDGIESETAGGLVAKLRPAVGCDVFSAWAASRAAIANVCGSDCLGEVCTTALGELVGQVRDGLATLDANHAAINVRGSVAARDRDRDGLVDDFGPTAQELEGNWGMADDADTQDDVSGELSSAPQTPLSL